MRLILVILFLILFFILSIPLFLVEYLIGKFNRRAMVASSQKIVVAAFRIILFLSGVKITAIGIENVPKDEAVLYIANHRSYFDVLVSYVTVPTLTGFMAKKEIKKVPFLRTWMGFLQCLFLDRDDVRQGMKVILKAIEQVKEGYSVFISPEGTRNQGKEMLPFKAGSFKVAEKTGCAIIPVSISNTDEIFENHQPWIRKAHVVIEYGKPVYPKDLDRDQLRSINTHIQEIIRKTLEKNASLI
ncbi:MAG: 1-acyl-sn-glycerol-3-phosphate acyltransferase [Clostridiales bacterium]|jgi:1-acyl-sn-glycerol-3-phosphate acyltransferase|nr:1-acyl-sn-glycerol-3-phosphate acyltransferase [Clostridiales bacterium]